MEFKEFESHLIDASKSFLEEYAENMRKESDVYPSEMGLADWYEQFQMFLETEGHL